MDWINKLIDQYLPFTADWSEDRWIAAISLLVAVLSLLYAFRGFYLQRRGFSLAQDELAKKEEQERDSKKREKEDLERIKKQVPDGIFFGDEVLLVPTPIEAGIPEEVSRLGIVETKVQGGDWVNRGEDLITITHRVFYHPKKPEGWFASDEIFSTEAKLTSPISGLVVGHAKAYVGYISTYPLATDSGNALVYGEKELFPIILVPKDEPEQRRYLLDSFYDQIVGTLNNCWNRIVYSQKSGCVRWGEIEPQKIGDEVKKTKLETFEIRKVTSDDWEILRNIQYLRETNLILRNKLVHITNEK